MSIEITKLVRKHARAHKTLRGGRLHVLLALAEHAHADGSKAHPGVNRLADETLLTERQVRRCLDDLEKAEIIVGEARPGRVTVFRINLEALTKCPPGQNVRGDISDSDPGHFEQQPRTFRTAHIDEPSKEPSEEPSHTTRVREAAPGKPRQGEILLPIDGGAMAGSAACPQKPAAEGDVVVAEMILAEFARYDGFRQDWTVTDVLDGLRRAGPDLPPGGELVAAAKRYVAWLNVRTAERKRARDGREPMTRPSNWLAQHAFKRFLGAPEQAPKVETVCDASWRAYRARAIAVLDSAAVFDQWLAPTTLELDGDNATIRCDTPFRRNWIAATFAAKLERAFGWHVMVTAHQKVRAA